MIGRIAIPLNNKQILRSGRDLYGHAIVASSDPFVLISSEGDMQWNTLDPDDFSFPCYADSQSLCAVLRRLERNAADERRRRR